ncbi:MAG: DUF503 domain-containing protein [bacterium JZ-2024 1]
MGYGWITIKLEGVRSLKAKRHLVKPLVEDIRRRFKVSVAEVDFMDVYDRARIGFANVGASEPDVRDFLENMVRLIELMPGLNVIDTQVDVV